MKKVEFNLDLELIGGEPDPAKQAPDCFSTTAFTGSMNSDHENNNNGTDTGAYKHNSYFIKFTI